MDQEQYLEFHFESPTNTHEEEVPTTSPKLDDVIERIGRLNLEENEVPLADQPRPSKKIPKWAIKILEIVHPKEVGKTKVINSTRQEDGGEANNLGDDMDVSFDCEGNLSAKFEETSFTKVDAGDECKESMKNEYDALINNGTWKLFETPVGTKPIGCNMMHS